MNQKIDNTARHQAIIYDAEADQWLAFSKPAAIYQCTTLDQVLTTLDTVETHVEDHGHYAVGFVSYEAAPACDPAIPVRDDPDPPPLCWFALFSEATPVSRPSPTPLETLDWTTDTDEAAYTRALDHVRDYIRSGDTYQVNHTLRLTATHPHPDTLSRFASMVQAQSDAYAAYLDTGRWVIASASPELFFSRHGTRLVSIPMKGTASRAPTNEADDRCAQQLQTSEKCRAENVMIVDMVRNDLGRIARPGTVTPTSLFDIEKYPTIWQMTSTVACDTDASLSETFQALFPPASITGAPKVHTCEIITALETTPRRVYTGAVGMIRPDGYTQFNVAIRTLLLDREKQQAEYGIGAGIVWDSEAALEYDECLAKAAILTTPPPEFSLLETMRWDGSAIILIQQHLARLARSADYFNVPLHLADIRHALNTQVPQTHAGVPARVRLVVDRNGHAQITTSSLPKMSSRPVRLRLDTTPICPTDPFLYHKTTQRERYDHARQQVPDADDVILWNSKGEITETTIANIAIERNGQLLTPPVQCGLLAGTRRQEMIESGTLTEAIITLSELEAAPKIYLISALRGVREAYLTKEPTAPYA
jgi:para-aminobenzoate synthetase/4-amino-4-deoxychorismate lyase